MTGDAPTESRELSTFERRIAMADVDGAQIIYFTSPLRWMETQFTDWLANIGRPLREILAAGLGMPIVACETAYRRSLRLDDVIEQRLSAGEVGRSSFAVECAVSLAGEEAARVRAVHVWSRRSDPGGSFAAVPLPDWLRAALTG